MRINRPNIIAAIACSAILALATTSMAQPLVNGNFETDTPPAAPTGWTLNLSGGTAQTTAAYAQSGAKSLVIDSTGAGAWASPNAFQEFSAAPGDEFNFKGYMLRSGPITDASFGLLKMEFRNAANGVLLPASASIGAINNSFPGVESTPFLNGGSALNTWVVTELQGVAPAGTVKVQFYLLNVNQGIAPGPMYFDNITATKINSSPLATSITSPANGATVTTNFTINASATVAPGTVTNVAFFDGATLLTNDTTFPFSYTYIGAPVSNNRQLKVVAKDSFGNSATSSVVTVNVVLPIFTLVPNGNFEIPDGASWGPSAGEGTVRSYPAAGGNPGGFGQIEQTGLGWGGVLVSEVDPFTGHSLASLGVTAGGTYTFTVDMISLGSVLPTSGMKIESWAGGAKLGDSSDVNFNITTSWATYTFDYTIHGSATSLKFVPLMVGDPIGAITGFDNVGVIGTGVPAVIPLNAQITTPANGALRPDYFDIKTSVAVSPGTITNVAFYDGATLLTELQSPPFDLLAYGPFSVGSHPLRIVAKDSNGNSVTSAIVNVTVSTAVNVTVDPVPVVNGITNTWLGYMNVLESLANPTNSLGFVFGSGWATDDLRATFCGSSLILSPNTINDPAPYWYVSTGNSSVGNKTMNANFYVEPAGSLPGQLVTFSGTVNLNTLVGPLNPAGQGWTVKAYIKDFAPNYSAFTPAEIVVPASGNFSVQLQTSYVAENHVQYGFTVEGPCVWPTDSALAGYGKVEIAATSAVKPAATTVTPSVSGGNLNLSFPTQACYAYTVLVKTNLTDATWSTLTVTNGTGGTAIVSTPTSGGGRFFRVSAQ